MALCNCSTPHPWLLHDFLLRSPSLAATLSFSLVLSPATRSFSLCIRIYIYIAPFLPFFPRLSSFIHFTVLAVNAINGFRFRCLNLAFSALCLQAAHLFLSTSVLRPFVLFYLSLPFCPFLSLYFSTKQTKNVARLWERIIARTRQRVSCVGAR